MKQSLLFKLAPFTKVMLLCLVVMQSLLFPDKHYGITNGAYALAADRPLYKSTWLWNTSSLMKNSNSTFEFLKSRQVNLIFLQIDPDVPQTEYSSFIEKASGLGIEVHALGGAPDWVLPDTQHKLYKLIDWVKSYNNSVSAEARFKGIHIDVEPIALPEWYDNTDTIVGLWRDTISGFVEEMRTETPDLIAGADLPVWLEKFNVPDGRGGRTTLSNWMISKLDLCALMAYRDNATDIIGSVSTELGEAEKNGKAVIVAVETLQSSEGPVSFYEKGNKQMLQELRTVVDKLLTRRSFAGYAVHDFEGWSSLKE